MGMELRHTFTVPASPEDTWALLTDLQQVGSCFPGAKVTEADGDTFSGTVKVKLGPIQMQYAGTGAFLERDDTAHRAVIEGKGKDKRGNGTAGATATMALIPDGEGTSVEVVTDLTVTGKPAQFGRGVMQDVSDKLLGQFVACLESTLGGEGADEGDGGEAAGDDAATTASDSSPAPDIAEPVTASGAAPSAAAATPEPVKDPSPGPSGSETPPLATPPRAAASTSTASPKHGSDDDAIDLGDLVGPVLLRRYGTAIAAGVIGLVIGIAIGRALGRD
ncbi:SRPBCC family protein [Ornithinimicrobium sp. F0845]|uniref:SRPBCC family protein n=1 Tax=Ornithinimicrobium sp. F0845 TaxID=2926412 RepID=UPI001FF66541|nr:SRPBCC family protein [Ornithinimicrobium sp. F0845]MCK0114212.1 SRPBCC family protein [Ornithinimicrobium sp. F0845]